MNRSIYYPVTSYFLYSMVAFMVTSMVILAMPHSAYGQFGNSATSPPANSGQPTTGTNNPTSGGPTAYDSQTGGSPSNNATSNTNANSNVNSSSTSGANSGNGNAGVSATGGGNFR